MMMRLGTVLRTVGLAAVLGAGSGAGPGLALERDVPESPVTDAAIPAVLVAQTRGESSIVVLQPPVQADYWLTLTATGGTIVARGYVPDNEMRRSLAATAGVNADAVQLASGEPAGFEGVLAYGMRIVSQLSEGTFTLRNLTMSIEGQAASSDSYRAILQQSPPRGYDLAIGGVRPPPASPYVWAAEKGEDGAFAVSGHVPVLATYDRLLDAVGSVEADTLIFADGAPEGFEASAMAGLAVLERLPAGAVRYDGTSWTIEGRADTTLQAAQAQTAYHNAGLAAAGWTYAVTLPPAPPVEEIPVIADYTWSAEKLPAGTIALSGYVPTEGMRRVLLNRAGQPLVDQLALGTGAPQSFPLDALAAIDALKLLDEGRATFSGGVWTLTGRSEAVSTVDAVDALLGERAGTWQVALTTPPPVAAEPEATEIAAADSSEGPETAESEVTAPAAAAETTESTELAEAASEPDEVPEPAEAPDAEAAADVAEADAADTADVVAVEVAPDADEATADAVPEDLSTEGEQVAAAEPADAAEQTAAEALEAFAEPVEEPASATAPLETESSALALDDPATQPAPDAEPVDGPDADIADVTADPALDAEPATSEATVPETPAEPANDVAALTAPVADPAEAVAPAESATDVAAPVTPAPGSLPESVDVPAQLLFDARRIDGGPVSLAGAVPAEAARAYFGVVAGDVPTDGLTIDTTLPSDFIANAEAGLRVLNQLYDGRVGFDGTHWYLNGTVNTPAEREAAAGQALIMLPPSGQWRTGIGLTPSLRVCRLMVASFAANSPILFQPGSARMTEESLASLGELAADLQVCPDTAVYVEGHTDSDGADDLNLALSVSRAEAVVDALVELGVSYQRLYAVGYGESLPIADNSTAAGKRANRRIEITILEEPEE